MTQQEKEILLKCTLAYQLALNAMDDVHDTSLYKHSLKGNMNRAEKEMEKILSRGFDQIYMDEEKSFSIFIERTNDIMDWINKAPFQDVLDLGKALKNGKLKFEDDE